MSINEQIEAAWNNDCHIQRDNTPTSATPHVANN